jgi:phosphohistidine phosphatase SixA
VHLYLVRHAEAEAGPQMDLTRTLTATGRDVQIPAIASFLVRQVGHIPNVLSSNMARARDTAKPLVDALGAACYDEIWQLDPDVEPEKAWKRIKQLTRGEDVLVVTHHPLVCTLLEYLCGAKTGEGTFTHASVACIHVEKQHLRWFVNPQLVERDQELEATREAALALASAALECLG